MRVRIRRWCGRHKIGTVVEGPEAERLLARYPHRVECLPDEMGGDQGAVASDEWAGARAPDEESNNETEVSPHE